MQYVFFVKRSPKHLEDRHCQLCEIEEEALVRDRTTFFKLMELLFYLYGCKELKISLA